MNKPVIAFFNNKGGVGKTSLVYHLSWMYATLGLHVLTADLDPQANLTAAFLNEERLEDLWSNENYSQKTIFGSVQPLIDATGDIANPHMEELEYNLKIILGDLALSSFEDQLSEVWPKCLEGDKRAFRIISAFWRILQKAAKVAESDIILVDVGPNRGAINRAALIASDYVVIPLSPDLFSLQGLKNLGPTLRDWREKWADRFKKNPMKDIDLPQGKMEPVGYIVLQHSVVSGQPVKAYEKWMRRIPEVYQKAVLGKFEGNIPKIEEDQHCLAHLKHYRSLMPMAQEARKPIFFLKSADGAIGSQLAAVRSAHHDFEQLARKIAERVGLDVPILIPQKEI